VHSVVNLATLTDNAAAFKKIGIKEPNRIDAQPKMLPLAPAVNIFLYSGAYI